jgi:hypothetical protein
LKVSVRVRGKGVYDEQQAAFKLSSDNKAHAHQQRVLPPHFDQVLRVCAESGLPRCNLPGQHVQLLGLAIALIEGIL